MAEIPFKKLNLTQQIFLEKLNTTNGISDISIEKQSDTTSIFSFQYKNFAHKVRFMKTKKGVTLSPQSKHELTLPTISYILENPILKNIKPKTEHKEYIQENIRAKKTKKKYKITKKSYKEQKEYKINVKKISRSQHKNTVLATLYKLEIISQKKYAQILFPCTFQILNKPLRKMLYSYLELDATIWYTKKALPDPSALILYPMKILEALTNKIFEDYGAKTNDLRLSDFFTEQNKNIITGSHKRKKKKNKKIYQEFTYLYSLYKTHRNQYMHALVYEGDVHIPSTKFAQELAFQTLTHLEKIARCMLK